MTDEQSNQLQDRDEQPRKKTAKERLKDCGFIDVTRPGSGTAFIGGIRSPKKHADEGDR
jgi:hypothetical protein